MKRTLLSISLLLSFAVSAQAQTTAKPKAEAKPAAAKAAPAPAAAATPAAPAKPKAKLLTRDELRSCLAMQDANQAEAAAIKAEQAGFKKTETELKAERAEVEAGEAELIKQADGVKLDRDAIIKDRDDIQANGSKMDKATQKARMEAFEKKRLDFDAAVTKLKEVDEKQRAKRKAFGDKVDALEAQFAAIDKRTEAHYDANDKWKTQCMGKDYDERDMKALEKEKAAAAAAAPAASAAK
ncbi:hypothetical protein [Roseateles paludis]|jgi:hypothetical protein|uniref:Uncharacterized protein n=1 Tax=Roseateles paludis TaxID=3145238 RepID=A0ABV0G3T7_9BURK